MKTVALAVAIVASWGCEADDGAASPDAVAGGADGGGDGMRRDAANGDASIAPDMTSGADAVSLPTPDSGSAGVPATMQPALALMNDARRETSSTGLTWDARISASAQGYADRCRFEHAAPGDRRLDGAVLGENLSATTSLRATADQLVQGWIDERAHFDCPANRCGSGQVCGHYTQVIWRATLRVGCGLTSCSTGNPWGRDGPWQFLVCRFAPAGNIIGESPIPASDCP